MWILNIVDFACTVEAFLNGTVKMRGNVNIYFASPFYSFPSDILFALRNSPVHVHCAPFGALGALNKNNCNSLCQPDSQIISI